MARQIFIVSSDDLLFNRIGAWHAKQDHLWMVRPHFIPVMWFWYRITAINYHFGRKFTKYLREKGQLHPDTWTLHFLGKDICETPLIEASRLPTYWHVSQITLLLVMWLTKMHLERLMFSVSTAGSMIDLKTGVYVNGWPSGYFEFNTRLCILIDGSAGHLGGRRTLNRGWNVLSRTAGIDFVVASGPSAKIF